MQLHSARAHLLGLYSLTPEPNPQQNPTPNITPQRRGLRSRVGQLHGDGGPDRFPDSVHGDPVRIPACLLGPCNLYTIPSKVLPSQARNSHFPPLPKQYRTHRQQHISNPARSLFSLALSFSCLSVCLSVHLFACFSLSLCFTLALSFVRHAGFPQQRGNHEYSCAQCCEPFPKHAPGYCDRSVCAWSENYTAYNTRFAMPGPASATPTAATAKSMYWSVVSSTSPRLTLPSLSPPSPMRPGHQPRGAKAESTACGFTRSLSLALARYGTHTRRAVRAQNYKSLHLVGIDAEYRNFVDHGFGEQLAWLAADLAAVNRTATPWVVVTGHYPAFSSFGQNMVDFNTTFGPLLQQHGVDVYHGGHVHNYERTLPQSGVVHLTNGAAGDTEACDPFPKSSPSWSAHRFSGFGWGELSANSTTLGWKFFRSKDGVLEDQWSKTKAGLPVSS